MRCGNGARVRHSKVTGGEHIWISGIRSWYFEVEMISSSSIDSFNLHTNSTSMYLEVAYM